MRGRRRASRVERCPEPLLASKLAKDLLPQLGLLHGDGFLFPYLIHYRVTVTTTFTSLYVALGLRVVVYTDGRVEIDLVPRSDYFPPEKETRELVERVVYDPERRRAKEELRRRVEERQKAGGVMPCGGLS